MIDFLAGDELAVVEAEAIVQKQLNVGNNQFAGVLVNGAVQFLLYHGEHTPKDFHFRSGEMQRLVAGIAEKLIAAHLPAQGGPVEKVGMENQGCELGKRHLGVGLHTSPKRMSSLSWANFGANSPNCVRPAVCVIFFCAMTGSITIANKDNNKNFFILNDKCVCA